MSLDAISSQEQSELKMLHEKFGDKVCLTGCTTAAAAFLLIGALIVITCGSLCLLLPGVNVITHIILPAIVPGLAAILASIPIIILTVKQSQEKHKLREKIIHSMVDLLENYDVPQKPAKERVRFILHNLLDWHAPEGKIEKNSFWTMDYQKKIISELKEKMGKEKSDRNPRQEKIARSLDKALIKLQKPKKN